MSTSTLGAARAKLIGAAVLTASSLLLAIPAVSHASAPLCAGLEATIVGTDGPDELNGTPGPDVIHGLDGDDRIVGGDGDDIICGGPGSDDIFGGLGDDAIYGGGRADTLRGGGGSDLVVGGPGSDRMLAGPGQDVVRGKMGDDRIYGGGGADDLRGGNGADAIYGGDGVDTVFGHPGDDTLLGGPDPGTVNGGAGIDRCDGLQCELDVIDYSVDRFLINQAVPQADSASSPADRVGTVVGRPGIVRVFISANQTGVPAPSVDLYVFDGVSTEKYPLQGPATVPTAPIESDLGSTYNLTFGSDFLKPGADVYVIVDRHDQTLELDESNNRYPVSGWVDVDARPVPEMKVTIVPITVQGGASASISQSQAEALYAKTFSVHPIAELDIVVRDNYVFESPTGTSQDWVDLLYEIADLREAEDPTRQYHALLAEGLSPGIGGIGFVGYPAALSLRNVETIAHETGHNLDLPHNPCSGEASPDPDFPYDYGSIGTWGYDVSSGATFNPGTYKDLMTYCGPEWVSDFSFNNALDFRTGVGGGTPWDVPAEGLAPAGTGTVIHLSGTLASEPDHAAVQHDLIGSVPGNSIRRVDVVDRKANPPEPGMYRMVGRDEDGRTVVSVPFRSYAIDHASGSFFTFSIEVPHRAAREIVQWAVERAGRPVATRANS